MTNQKPSVGRVVHYVQTEVPNECRAAIVTDVPDDPDRPTAVSVMVCNPGGVFFKTVDYHDGAEVPGDPECPSADYHGDPHRYCSCGWMEASHVGGTWHWPEPA